MNDMKVKFKDQKVTASNGNSWIVSGYWDFEISQIRLSRIEGSITDDGIGEACYNLAINKGWL